MKFCELTNGCFRALDLDNKIAIQVDPINSEIEYAINEDICLSNCDDLLIKQSISKNKFIDEFNKVKAILFSAGKIELDGRVVNAPDIEFAKLEKCLI